MIFGDFVYSASLEIFVAFNKKDFFEALEQIDKKKSLGYLVGYIKYEAWHYFIDEEYYSKTPLLYFELFAERTPFCPNDMEYNVFYPKVVQKQNFTLYKNNIAKIKSAIKRGDTYQVNYTYPIELFTHCNYRHIFSQILKNQNTAYKAFIENQYEAILSFSPELFFELKDRQIIARPMKGTIKRDKDPVIDKQNKDFLQNDEKNKSENVMIVDLLRNDLSKIGSEVRVSALFKILSFPTLHQMISEIKASVDSVSFVDILRALFPCGSITGAPKLKTIEIIQKLEKKPRNVYCGLIGVLHQDEMCFSVPIRTLYHDKRAKNLLLNVGSGIVWDSVANEEYQESILKSQFIFPQNDFLLVETMLVKNGKICNFSLHQKRILQTARFFGFQKPDLSKIKIPHNAILRILVDRNGRFYQENKSVAEITNFQITLASAPIDSQNDFLYHKTTYAPWYEEARKKIKNNEIFDCIFFNQKGELTEGARSNLVLKINNDFFTPPVNVGILNGVMRQKMLKSKKLKEKVLYKEDIYKAQKIFCINSIRGMVEVFL